MSLPSVSIIIPSYNYEQYVCYAIDSCLSQKYDGKLEIIVVDDCSTDCTMERLQEYGSAITIVRHKGNRGYSAAKNSGIRASSGELISLLDADDMLTPDSIALRAQYLAKFPELDMVHGRAYIVKDDGDQRYWQRRLYKIQINKKNKY